MFFLMYFTDIVLAKMPKRPVGILIQGCFFFRKSTENMSSGGHMTITLQVLALAF